MAEPDRAPSADPAPRLIRDIAFDVLRQHGATTLFANPGTTELALLAAIPDDFTFILGLQEGALVSIATGFAMGDGAPAVVLLHTAAGLGNAVGAIATARVNRVPLVVLVGQQDRRHLDTDPFLAGQLHGMAGDYPVAWLESAVPHHVPATLRRAFHEAELRSGPVVVVVPMGDWTEPFDEGEPVAAPATLVRVAASEVTIDPRLLDEFRAVRRWAIVAGAGADTASGWAAVGDLAEMLGAPVYQDTFSPQAGVPHAHPRYCGVLPGSRSARRAALADYDAVLVLGAAAFRGFRYEPGPFVDSGTRTIVVTDDPAEATRSAADVAVVGPVALIVSEIAAVLGGRDSAGSAPDQPRSRTESAADRGTPTPNDDARLDSDNVIGLLGEILPADCVVFEEAPSFRHRIVGELPRSQPRTLFSAAMGGLGFAAPATIGMRLADDRRHVAAIVGDGSVLYTVQALWTAAHYHIGATIFVLANGGYAVMDRQATERGEKPAWPGFAEISIAHLSASLGCPARRVETAGQLRGVAARWQGSASELTEPLVVEVSL